MKLVMLAAGLMFAAVALGAFGAHGLRASLEASGHQGTWETAVHYQVMHGLALLALGIWQAVDPRVTRARGLRTAAWLWGIGITAFSGSLYWLSMGGPKWLGPVTPVGGLCFLAGWAILAWVAWGMGRRVQPGA